MPSTETRITPMTIARQKGPDRRVDIAAKDAKRVLDPCVREADHAESGEVLSHQGRSRRVGVQVHPGGRGCHVMTPNPIVFLVDVDNTLLNNDHIQNDLRHYLEREFGTACRDRYWAILEEIFDETGYRDYLGALQRYRTEHPTDVRLLSVSSYLVDYPFANRLYPAALDVLERFRGWGQTVILSDGDVVFQARKVE